MLLIELDMVASITSMPNLLHRLIQSKSKILNFEIASLFVDEFKLVKSNTTTWLQQIFMFERLLNFLVNELFSSSQKFTLLRF